MKKNIFILINNDAAMDSEIINYWRQLPSISAMVLWLIDIELIILIFFAIYIGDRTQKKKIGMMELTGGES